MGAGRKTLPVRGELVNVKGRDILGTTRLKIKITDGPTNMIDKEVYVELSADDTDKLANALQDNLFLKGPVEFK